MASIHTPGVAAASRSGYSARPDRLDHAAYGIEHVLYSRRTSVGHRQEAATGGRSGILPGVSPGGGAQSHAAPWRMRGPARARPPPAWTPLPGSGSDTATARGRGESDR
ncbi:hypothetical protein AV521_38715 [Streptomyces sp. IMTB 2501]|nr:hypothetical protein AV521_38715 [Streptomyces sp. IMTB 2501]